MTDEQLFQQDGSLSLVQKGLMTNSLLYAIQRNPKLWEYNTWRQDDAWGMQDTEAIMFRWADGNSFERVRDSDSVVDTGLLDEVPEMQEIIEYTMTRLEATELGRVFVVKLKPGGRVFPHADVGVYSDKFERFHVCLKSSPGFEYYSQHPLGPVQKCFMKPGDLWWFNHKRVHWAYNGGREDRISIVFDCVAPKWKRKRDVLALSVYNEGQS